MNYPVKKIINNQTLNHNMFTGSVIHACTILDKTISVPSQIVTWNNLESNLMSQQKALADKPSRKNKLHDAGYHSYIQ